MMVGGLGADVQPCGDLRAGQAIADKFKDLQLPGWSARADWLGWRAGAAIRQKRQISVGTPPTHQHEAYLGGHSGGNQQRTGGLDGLHDVNSASKIPGSTPLNG